MQGSWKHSSRHFLQDRHCFVAVSNYNNALFVGTVNCCWQDSIFGLTLCVSVTKDIVEWNKTIMIWTLWTITCHLKDEIPLKTKWKFLGNPLPITATPSRQFGGILKVPRRFPYSSKKVPRKYLESPVKVCWKSQKSPISEQWKFQKRS